MVLYTAIRKHGLPIRVQIVGKRWYESGLLAMADANGPSQEGDFAGFTLTHNVRFEEEVDRVLQQAQQAGAPLAKPPAERDWGGYSGY